MTKEVAVLSPQSKKKPLKAPKLKKITLSEFRAWLSGVEEMQSEDWFPSREQWNTIRAKIDSIEESTKPFNNGAQAPQNNVQQQFPPQVPAQNQSAFTPTFARPAGPVDNRPLATGNPNIPMVDGKIKTPDIDSSGGYTSSFV